MRPPLRLCPQSSPLIPSHSFSPLFSLLQIQYTVCQCFLLFIFVLNLFRYAAFQKRLGASGEMTRQVLPEVIYLVIVMLVMLTMMAVLFNVLWGQWISGISTLSESLWFLVIFTLGGRDPDEFLEIMEVGG
jgi:sterol desaturase/sphingolipid hydroxylase (fatty acid hydroxylase superfamily)